MKQIKLASTISIKDFGQQKQLKIAIDSNTNQQLCLILFLLNESLISVAQIRFENFVIFLKREDNNSSSYSFLDLKNGTLKAEITRQNLEYILHFLLKYYRDGFGEAEHIDVDFINEEGHECTLTFICDDYKHYTEEDIIQMLK